MQMVVPVLQCQEKNGVVRCTEKIYSLSITIFAMVHTCVIMVLVSWRISPNSLVIPGRVWSLFSSSCLFLARRSAFADSSW